MKRILDNLKRVHWRQAIVYSCSFLIYLGINKLSSNSILLLLGEDSFRERWTNFSVPCGATETPPTGFMILFQLLKLILFGIMFFISRKNSKSFLSEILIAYFMYDLVYVLAFFWEFIPLPFSLNTWWILSSSGQIFLSRYMSYLDLIFAGLWTAALFLFLLQQHRLSMPFIFKRLFVITLTVPIFFLMIFFFTYPK